MSSTLYSDSFQRARPNLTHRAVSSRLQLTRALTQDLAQYYHERTLLEEHYVRSLQKLSARLHGSGGKDTVFASVEALSLDSRDQQQQLGAWNSVRQRLETELVETSKSHEQYRKKLVEEVETPLRQSVGKSEWQRWSQQDSQLGSSVKEYDTTLDKVQKAQQKGASKSSKSTTSKLLTAQSQLSSLGSSITSSLPSFLNSSQSLELSHAAFLKEALIRAGTISSDLGRERMEVGERLLATVLGVDDEVEMQTWALRESMRAGGTTTTGGGRGGSPSINSVGNGSGFNEFGAASGNNHTRGREDSIAEEPASLGAPVPERQRVPSISRTAPPPVAPLPLPTATTPSKSSGGGLKSLFKRDRSSSVAGSSKYGNLDAPQPSYNNNGQDRPSIDSRDSDAGDNSLSAPAFNRTESGSSSLMGGSSSAGGMQAPIMPSSRNSNDNNNNKSGGGNKKRESLMPFGGGSLFRRPSKLNTLDSFNNNNNNARQEGVESLPDSPEPNSVSSFAPSSHQPAAGTVDEEGYSVPPAGYDKQPWESNQSGNGNNNNLMDEDDEEASETPSALHKLPAVAIAPATITESDNDRQAALERVKSTLLTSGPSTNLQRRTTRGRRDVRMTTFNPVIPDDVPLAKIIEQQRTREQSNDSTLASTLPSPITTTGFSPINGGRANSIMSTMSSSTTRTHALAGPDPFAEATSPGLRANITETVNVLFKGTSIERVMITGEIALSYRPSSPPSSTTSPLRIRIASFEQFEKAAPNSAYLVPLVDSPGEYTLLPSLSSNQGHTVTVLKYQLHLSDDSSQTTLKTFAPVRVRAAWKCEEGQSKIMVTYFSNPTSRLALSSSSTSAPSPFGDDDDSSTSSTTLEDLSFALPMSTPVTTFQAKPSASWSAERARFTFSVPSLPLSSSTTSSEEQKLLTMVKTEGTATPQPVAVRWKVIGKTVSGVGVELVGDGGGEEVVEEVRRSTVAGKYLVS